MKYTLPGGSCQTEDCDLVGLGWGVRFCISNMSSALSGNMAAPLHLRQTSNNNLSSTNKNYLLLSLVNVRAEIFF